MIHLSPLDPNPPQLLLVEGFVLNQFGTVNGDMGRQDGAMGKLEPHLWDIVVPPLPLLLLQFDGDAADGAPLDPLHQVGDVPAGTRACPGPSQAHVTLPHTPNPGTAAGRGSATATPAMFHH